MMKRPLTHADNHAGRLEDGKKLARSHDPALRIIPPQQSFHAPQLAGRNVDFRLVIKKVTVVVEGAAQAMLQGEPGRQLRAEVEAMVMVLLAGGLCLTQSCFGILHERLRIRARGTAAGKTRFDRYGDIVGFYPEWPLEQSNDVLLQLAKRGVLSIGVHEEHPKATGAHVGERVRVESCPQAVGNQGEQVVARMSALRVIDDAQMLDVDDRDRGLRFFRLARCQPGRQAFAEQDPFGKSRQRVEVGEKLDGTFLLEILQCE